MRLKDKVALVTGSSQGIGAAIALRFAAEGANVVINYNSNPDKANDVLAQVEAASGHGHIVGANLGSVEDVRRLIAESVSHFGRLDILVNNAGIEVHAPFWDVTEADYDKVMNVNAKGVFFATQEMAKHLMTTQRPGKIINISSVHEDLPFPNFTAYCMSKGGVKMMTRNLSIELAPFGITINSIAPGAIQTPINTALLNDPVKLNALLNQIPLRRLGKPEDVAGLGVFLASSEADYVTGTTYFVDGGLTWNYQEQ
jgi:glucose 1-dehydrogenase